MKRYPNAFTLYISLLFLVISPLAFAKKEADTFTLVNGVELEGQLIGVYNGIVFVDTGRKGTVSFSYHALADSSKESARAWFEKYVAGFSKERVNLGEVDSKLAKFLSGNLVRIREGELLECDYSKEKEPEFYAFYFSAHWCGPCRRFTPKLVAFYNSMKQQGHDFELIFVSSDEGPKAMEKYMKEAKMPWPAVKFNKSENRLLSGYRGSGIPCLVVTDRAGKVLFHSYEGSEYVGPSTPMRKLEKALQASTTLRKKVGGGAAVSSN